jgi:hypothetical protein
MAFDLTHARHDPAHCLAPGLFRSLKRGDRKKLKLDVTYIYGEDTQARFVGFEPLDAGDQPFQGEAFLCSKSLAVETWG